MKTEDRNAAYQERLGKRLRELRTAAGKTLADVAFEIGVTFSQVSRYELGQAPIPPAYLARLATLYGVSMAKIFMGVSAP